MADRYTYTIDDNNAVSFFDAERPNENGAPFLFQPHDPIRPTDVWTREEATAWAEVWLENLINPISAPDPILEVSNDPNVIEVVPAE